MFIENIIQESFKTLVGWNNNTLPEFVLNSENSDSESLLKFNDANHLCSLKNLYYTAQKENMSDDDFNAYLSNQKKAAILSMLNKVTSCVGSFQINNGYTFDASKGTTIDIVTDNKHGYKINLLSNKIVRLNKLTLYSYETNDIIIELHNTNSQNYIERKTISSELNKSSSIYLGWILSRKDGGQYYITIEDSNFSTPYFGFNANKGNTSGYYLEPINMTDFDDVESSNFDTFGLDISTYDDYTDFLVNNRNQFATLLQYAVGINILKQILNSVRSNVVERLSGEVKAMAYEGLNGSENKEGLIFEYNQLIKKKQKELFNTPIISKSTLC